MDYDGVPSYAYNSANTNAVQSATSSTTFACTIGTNCAYPGTDLQITLNNTSSSSVSWIVYGFASLYNGNNADTDALALYNTSTSAVVANSQSAAGSESVLGQMLAFNTQSIVNVPASTSYTIELYGLRNGSSTLNFWGGGGITNTQGLTAYRL